MRVGLQGWGSEGDLRPLVALAARLRKSGHEARVVVTPIDGTDYAPLCESLGVGLRAVPERMPVTLQQLVRDAASADPTKLMSAILDSDFLPPPRSDVRGLARLVRQLGCRGRRYVMLAAQGGESSREGPLCRPRLRSRHRSVARDPSAIFPAWRWLARPAWALLGVMFDMAFREAPRRFFAAKGLPRIRHVIPDVIFSGHLNLHAASPAFWPAAADWSEIHCVCGELSMPPEAETWAPSSGLDAFLRDGSEPVLWTLGSWEHMAPVRVRTLLVESARQSKMRAIIQTKTSDTEGRDGDLYFLPWAPHRHLAPLCSVVVHHGGAGTTHMALRAGKPAFVLPFILEQRMWAKRVKKVGAGDWLSFWKATPQKVGSLIRGIVGSTSLRRRAAEMASAMVDEDGTGIATARLERLVAGELHACEHSQPDLHGEG